MNSSESFSRRNQFNAPAKEITVREDAPESLRVTVLESASSLGWTPSALRGIVCRVLRAKPDAGNWSESNVWGEVQWHVYNCPWFKVYDIIEALYAEMLNDAGRQSRGKPGKFAEEINACFVEEGIGWQLVDGMIVTRGPESFESITKSASQTVEQSGCPTAANHLHEALQDLSRRPSADLSGAVYHAMGALEAVAREVAEDPKATLGQIVKNYPGLLPPPLDTALAQIWGFASNEARHVVEGRTPTREEAELIVGLSATLATYLVRKRA